MQESIEESKIEETAVHEITLTYTEEQLFEAAGGKLRANDLEGAARVLNENESAFQDLFLENWRIEICLYDGSVMKETRADGFGLVFQRAELSSTVRLKTEPSGQCVALQAITLDEESVTITPTEHGWMASWKAPESAVTIIMRCNRGRGKKTVKKGTFSNDLMEGEITLYFFPPDTGERDFP